MAKRRSRKPGSDDTLSQLHLESNPLSSDTVEHVEVDEGKEKEEQKKQLDDLKEEFAGSIKEASVKRRVQRQKKSEADEAERAREQAKIDSLKADFGLFGSILLEVICTRMPNPLPPTPGEKQLFGNATSRLVEKYAPKLGGWEAELTFAFAAVVVLAPRLKAKGAKPKPGEEIPSGGMPVPFVEPEDGSGEIVSSTAPALSTVTVPLPSGG